MIGPTGCSRYSKDVTIPKLPPPPRTPRRDPHSPACLRSAAGHRRSRYRPTGGCPRPGRASTSASPARRRASGPRCRCARRRRRSSRDRTPAPRDPGRSKSTPGSARAMRATGSIRTLFMRDRSMTMPPSQTEWPATLWPPPRTARSRPCVRAKLTDAITSAVPAHLTINPGRLSIDPFHTCRASSYPASSGRINWPRRVAANAATVAESGIGFPA